MTDEERDYWERHTLIGASERLNRAGRALLDATGIVPRVEWILDCVSRLLRRISGQ